MNFRAILRQFLLFFLVAGLSQTQTCFAQGTKADYQRANGLWQKSKNKVFQREVEAHWYGDGLFWYRNDLSGGRKEFVQVNASRGVKKAAFNHKALAKALKKASGEEVDAKALPFGEILIEGEKISFNAFKSGWVWRMDLPKLEKTESVDVPKIGKEPKYSTNGPGAYRGKTSPNGKWTVLVEGYNLWLKEKDNDEKKQISFDGKAGDDYTQVYWAGDSLRFVGLRRKAGDSRKVYMVESSPKDQLQPKLHNYNYLKPGDKVSESKPVLLHVDGGKAIAIDDGLFKDAFSNGRWRWTKDSHEFTFLHNQRGHQSLRVIGVDGVTGKTRVIAGDTAETFVHYSGKTFTYPLDETGEMIWMSERSGWNHLYLYDTLTGKVKNAITKGKWVLRKVLRVDVEKRQVWFTMSGYHQGQDPYHIHYARVNFDGSGFTVLTDGDGTHSVKWSPDGEYFVDSYSRIDMAGITELRRARDGRKLCLLEKADMRALVKTGLGKVERFVAKGRDGKTDIWGIIVRPTNFDKKKTYPVIEYIYAGPHNSFVPKKFYPYLNIQAMADVGFIVVQIDGMGTSNRGKVFHDVCWQNLGDSGFPDRILWMKAAAKKFKQMDLSQVGIYGGSAGGQSSTRALLAFGDFYKAAVSDCGCHDNRMDKMWWNEQWMGYPIGPHYKEQSNVTQAHRLQGKLMLVVGELDRNVDPASTMQVVNALVKADKDFDLLVVPGGGHGVCERPYGKRRRRDFFVRHLLGVEPRSK